MNRKSVDEKIQEIAGKIQKDFHPDKIILFGSYAWGEPGPDSDVDFFVVKDTPNTREMARKIDGSLWGRTIPMDIVVYTPESVERNLEEGDFFVKNIFQKGKVLYAHE